MLEKSNIKEIIEKAFEGSDFYLVDLTVSRSNLIQVFFDHPNGISLDDCARFSLLLNETLDREKEDFELQVSSPGLGQPLKVFRQYLKAVGQKLDIILVSGDKVRGTLLEAKPLEAETGGVVSVLPSGTKKKPYTGEPIEIRMNEIQTARVEMDFKQV